VARANVARAEETLVLVRRQYEGGSATVTRYLEAETDRTDALVREVAARYGVKRAGAALGHVLGLCHRCAAGWMEP
jgi:outer membrane protein TolC